MQLPEASRALDSFFDENLNLRIEEIKEELRKHLCTYSNNFSNYLSNKSLIYQKNKIDFLLDFCNENKTNLLKNTTKFVRSLEQF